MDSILSNKNVYFLYFSVALVYISGLFIPLMESDSAQHATMAMRMYLENDFIHLFRGFDEYLDKPHMHFWLSALSFKLFGITHWAYRLPAVLFTVLGAFSCYKLAVEFYGNKAGHIASLIFLSAQAVILANHDVRTDAVLTGTCIFGIWQLVKYINYEKTLNVILGSMAIGVAFSTKGLLGIVMIGVPLFCYVLYNRKWAVLFSWKILLGILIFLLASSPMLYAYYLQYDLYPDKIVNGQKNVSGIKFIFWDQSFNRLTGSGFNSNNKDLFFFFHTLLWAFLPWAFITYYSIFERTKEFITNKFKYKKGVEFLTIGGFWLIILIINTSKSKLPHYMNSMFPILAVLLSGYLVSLFTNKRERTLKTFLIIQYVILAFGTILITALVIFVFPVPTIWLCLYATILITLIYFIVKKYEVTTKIVTISVLFSVFANICLNTQFYPNLLEFQGGYKMTQIIEQESIDVNDIYILDKKYSWPLNFYTQRETPSITIDNVNENSGKWLFVYDKDIELLESQNVEWNKQYVVPHFRVTRLKLSFLNPKTRDKQLRKAYLINLK